MIVRGMRKFLLLPIALAAFVALGLFRAGIPPKPDGIEHAASAFLASLDDAKRARATFPLDDARRVDWHYIPRERPGLPIGDLDAAQKKQMRSLLEAVLSDEGLKKVDGVFLLEGVLRELESSPMRDPGHYMVSLFGEPRSDKPWAWRLEGHHLSLNLLVNGDRVAVTPFFLGANPEKVESGPHAGLRVLAPEEDLARALVKSLDAAQRTTGLSAKEAPADVILGPGRAASFLEPPGIDGVNLREDQRALLRKLAELYPGDLDASVASNAIDRVREATDKDLHFLWIGGTEPGEPHYWRVQGKDFAIELDNVQGAATHVHTLWRDLDDFGEDLLHQHYVEHHSGK
jgi:hypothetical protein